MKQVAVVCIGLAFAVAGASDALGWGSVHGAYGWAAYRGPMGGAAVRGPHGGAAARGPYGGTAYRVPNTVYRGGAYYHGALITAAPPSSHRELVRASQLRLV